MANNDTFRTFIVEAAPITAARQLASKWPGGVGMLTTPLTSDGTTVSHYISSGLVDTESQQHMPYSEWTQDEEGNYVETTHEGDLEALAEETETPIGQLQALLAVASITNEKPRDAMRRLGLSILVNTEEV